MRIMVKIILFPLTFSLSIIVLLLNFLITYGGALASVLAGLFFTIGVVLTGARLFSIAGVDSTHWSVILTPYVVAFLLSPYGLTGLVSLVASGLDSFNGVLKSI